MEAWKFVNQSRLSPILALSLTAERWGLEPLPGNLKASPGYLWDIEGKNNTVLFAWESPPLCATSSRSSSWLLNHYFQSSNYYTVLNGSSVSTSDKICARPQNCGDCTNLIEGIGRTTVGPAASNIVGLSHGLSILIIIISAIIMGGCSSALESEYKPKRGLQRRDIEEYYTPSARSYDKAPRREAPPQLPISSATGADKAQQISHCADLLRKMYELDILIWSMEDCSKSEEDEREKMKAKADDLYAEIQRIINTWKAISLGTFSGEERGYIDKIHIALDTHNRQGYHAGRLK